MPTNSSMRRRPSLTLSLPSPSSASPSSSLASLAASPPLTTAWLSSRSQPTFPPPSLSPTLSSSAGITCTFGPSGSLPRPFPPLSSSGALSRSSSFESASGNPLVRYLVLSCILPFSIAAHAPASAPVVPAPRAVSGMQQIIRASMGGSARLQRLASGRTKSALFYRAFNARVPAMNSVREPRGPDLATA
ncbi:transmembrane protein 107 [Thecamonas trahens ATCC 50062]|uniref:Transmembrane protein 107 n=1 Tax=Thecamonas trahens ATCC 50062 TaxID=461836 RepID=A0A0L0DQC5_THETB|nr:transmembrane protein 107 [Thecamonas trahens ATCC 50062]KNC53603.1 transmembrane protein 107 [Thecamonas trahens ATCC 50062]|eukprot:XP_013761920.1 transmembrane protein 107 [Thecamonas trahens ATCC 50062]